MNVSKKSPSNRIAIVTGGSSGIGAAIVDILLKNDYKTI